MLEFTVLGQPVAKGRPRVTKWGSYTPEKTVNYENLVKYSYIEKYKDENATDAALGVEITFYFQIPKSTSKKNKELMLKGEIRPTKKPDIDNCIKSITDALNTIAYKDDSQIIDVVAHKYYSDDPRTEVIIKELF